MQAYFDQPGCVRFESPKTAGPLLSMAITIRTNRPVTLFTTPP